MYTTVREELKRMAELRELLAGQYEVLARREAQPEQVGMFLETLADEERQLATGLQAFASRDERALEAWVQFPVELPQLPLEAPVDLPEVLELANAVDDALLQLCRPVAAAGSSAVRSWCESLADTTEARNRNRARALTLEAWRIA